MDVVLALFLLLSPTIHPSFSSLVFVALLCRGPLEPVHAFRWPVVALRSSSLLLPSFLPLTSRAGVTLILDCASAWSPVCTPEM